MSAGRRPRPQVEAILTDNRGNPLDGTGRLQTPPLVPSSGASGSLSTVSPPSPLAIRVMTVRAFGNGGDGTITFTGGSLNGLIITVRNGTGFDWTPATEQTCATSVAFSAALDYFIEWG